jgi:hypothetical protein
MYDVGCLQGQDAPMLVPGELLSTATLRRNTQVHSPFRETQNSARDNEAKKGRGTSLTNRALIAKLDGANLGIG